MNYKPRRQEAHDDYGDLVGYLKPADSGDTVTMIDAEGYVLGTARSVDGGRRELLNRNYNDKQYFQKAKKRR